MDEPADAPWQGKDEIASVVADPTRRRNTTDPGDATSRNYRYQHAYGIIIMVAADRGVRPYVAIWCEHHEDFLAQRSDDVFDGYQIKTSRPESGAWKLTDGELTKSIGRFLDLVEAFGDKIGDLFFVSNKDFDRVTPESKNERQRGRCPGLFLEHVKSCSARSEIAAPFDSAFDELQATCGCSPEQLIAVLHRMDLVVGPSRGEFDATISNEHLPQLDDCRSLTPDQLNAFRDDLVALIHRASSLQVTDPIRHLRPLVAPRDGDPALAAKKIVIADALRYDGGSATPDFRYPGDPKLDLGAGLKSDVLEQKFDAAGLKEDIEYISERARAAEYNLLEDVMRRPERFPALLRQIEQRVHGELSEAYLRARQQTAPFGPAMLIDAQDRLRRVAADDAAIIGGHSYDCLVGVAGLLTGECRVWWSPRFPLNPPVVT